MILRILSMYCRIAILLSRFKAFNFNCTEIRDSYLKNLNHNYGYNIIIFSMERIRFFACTIEDI